MPHVRMELRDPNPRTWLEDISRQMPAETFRVLSGHRRDNGLVGVVEVESSNQDQIRESLQNSSKTGSNTVLHDDEHALLIQYVGNEPLMYRIVRDIGILPQYPLDMRNGWVSTSMFVSQSLLSSYRKTLDASDIEYRVISVRDSFESKDLLTDKQKEAVSTGISLGYYDTPRRCTLSEIAEELDVTKSAVGRLLQRAETRMVKSVFGQTQINSHR